EMFILIQPGLLRMKTGKCLKGNIFLRQKNMLEMPATTLAIQKHSLILKMRILRFSEQITDPRPRSIILHYSSTELPGIMQISDRLCGERLFYLPCLFLRICLTDEKKRNLDLLIHDSFSCTGSPPWWAILNQVLLFSHLLTRPLRLPVCASSSHLPEEVEAWGYEECAPPRGPRPSASKTTASEQQALVLPTPHS
ncbi:unnamed protein product, partial [Rangifer tarandus platyrhynchus]